MHIRRRIFQNIVVFCVFSLLVFSFQNCGSGLQVQSSSREKQASLTDPGIQPPIAPVNNAGQVVKLKSLGGFSYIGGVCGVDFSDQLVCWGKTSANPEVVPGLTNVVDYVSASNQTCVLDKAGKVLCWGYQKPAIVEITGMGKVVQLTAGNMMVCGLNDQARVFCLGYPLGETPYELEGLRGSKKITGGISHVCGITAAGAVNCSYRSSSAVNGAIVYNWVIVPIAGLTDIVDLRSGGGFPVQVCALDKTGLLSCFTESAQGSPTPFSPPKTNPGLGLVKMFDVGGGDGGVCAMDLGDKVWCFGPNERYQINNSPMISFPSATLVLSRKVLQIHRTQMGVTCVLNIDNTVQCWGAPSIELGFDQVHIFKDAFAVPDLNGVKQMEFFSEYYIPDVFILKDNGTVFCKSFGRNYTALPASEACATSGDNFIPFHSMQNVKQISGNLSERMCALFNTGNVTCWGKVSLTSRMASPESELGVLPELQNITQIVSGYGGDLCAVTGAGKVFCSFKIYVNGQDTFSNLTEVTSLSNVKQVGMTYRELCALTNDSIVTCRKSNAETVDLAIGIPLSVTEVDQLYSESYWGYYCAVKKDGSVLCWNSTDDIGKGVVSFVPKALAGFVDIKKLFMGRKGYAEGEANAAQVCGIDGTKKVKCIGENQTGQLSVQDYASTDNLFMGTGFVCAQGAAGTACHGFKPFRNLADFLGQPIRWP